MREFWVTNIAANAVWVCSYDKVFDTIIVGDGPRCIAFSVDGKLAFVANAHTRSVSVLDVQQRTVVRNLESDWHPLAVTVTPDGRFICVTVDSSPTGLLILYETGTYKRAAIIKVGKQPSWVSASGNERDTLICVANFKSATVSVVNTATKSVVATVSVCDGPTTVAMTPRGDKAYVSCPNLGCLNFDGGWNLPVIDLDTKKWTKSIAVDAQPFHAAVGTRAAYVTSAPFLDAIDTGSDQLTGDVPTAGQVPWPACVALNEQDSRCVVTDPPAALLSIIDTSNLTIVGTIQLKKGDRPFAVAFRN